VLVSCAVWRVTSIARSDFERPAAEPDGGVFRPWAGDAEPPSRSLPAHPVAKAAARISARASCAVHEWLPRAELCERWVARSLERGRPGAEA